MNLYERADAARQYELARLAKDASQLDEAARRIRMAVHLNPEHAPARLVQAQIAMARGDAAAALDAIRLIELCNAEAAQQPEIQMLRAQALIMVEQDEEAIDLVTALCEQFPDDLRPRAMWFGLAGKQGHLAAQQECLEQLIRMQPHDLALKLQLSELLATTSPRTAPGLLSSLPERTDSETMLRAARVMHKAGRLADSDQLFRRVLEQWPGDAHVLMEWGELADDLGADAEATDRLTRALSSSGHHRSRAWRSLARAHTHAGRFASAGRCWWSMLREEQTKADAPYLQDADAIGDAWVGLLACALATGRSRLVRRARQAIATIKQNTAASSDTTASGQAQQSTQNQSSAQSQPAASQAADIRLLEAWLHTAAGQSIAACRSDEALPTYRGNSPLTEMLQRGAQRLRSHIEQQPQRADAHYHFAQCAYPLGDEHAADAALGKALSINPEYAAAQALRDEQQALRTPRPPQTQNDQAA